MCLLANEMVPLTGSDMLRFRVSYWNILKLPMRYPTLRNSCSELQSWFRLWMSKQVPLWLSPATLPEVFVAVWWVADYNGIFLWGAFPPVDLRAVCLVRGLAGFVFGFWTSTGVSFFMSLATPPEEFVVVLQAAGFDECLVRGGFPPVDLRAVCLVRSIVGWVSYEGRMLVDDGDCHSVV